MKEAEEACVFEIQCFGTQTEICWNFHLSRHWATRTLTSGVATLFGIRGKYQRWSLL